MKIFEAREGALSINMDKVTHVEFIQYSAAEKGALQEYASVVFENGKSIIIDGYDAVALKNFLQNKGEIII